MHMDATLSFGSTSGGNVRTPVPRTQLNGAPPPPPGLEVQSHPSSPHGIPVNAAPVRPRSQLALAFTSSGASFAATSTAPLQPQVSTTQVGTHSDRSSPAHSWSAGTAQAGTHSAIGADPHIGRGPFPKPRPVVLPVVSFGRAKPAGLGHILQWNPGPARRNPRQIIAAACGRHYAVILQEASDHVPHITDQFIAYTGNTDFAILVNKDTFEPNPAVFVFYEASTSKDTRVMVLLIVRGFLRRLFFFRHPYGHILLCSRTQCRGQET